VIDVKPRPGGFTKSQNDTLVDLAAMAVKVMVDRRNQLESREDPARLIAYTAHDLMTPLTGVQLSLSLLTEDEEVCQKLNPHQMELLTTASSCSDLMIRICETAIDSLRQHPAANKNNSVDNKNAATNRDVGINVTRVVDLVKNLQMIMEPIPKKVPLIITLDPAVPHTIVSDDLKLFRSALNLVSNAAGRTVTGKVHLRIYTKGDKSNRHLVFECEDTGEDIPVEEYQYLFQPSATEESNLRLGLSSVASLVDSQAGEYGFRPRALAVEGTKLRDARGNLRQGSIFWFSVPLIIMEGDVSISAGQSRSASLKKLPVENHNIPPVEQSAMKPPAAQLYSSEWDLERKMSASSITSSLHAVQQAAAAAAAVPVTQRPRSANMPFVPLVLRSGSKDSFSALGQRRHQQRQQQFASSQMRNAVFTGPDNAIPVEGDEDRKIPPEQPQCFDRPAPVVIAAPAASVSVKGPRQKRALVIEDSLVVRKSLARALNKLGFEVEQAVNGLEGLGYLKDILFDIVLCDFLMPVMDGLDCVMQYRAWEKENRPHFRQLIIGISAHVSVEDSGQGLDAGMDDFRPKPISIKTLTELQNSDEVTHRAKLLDQIEVGVISSDENPHGCARVVDDSDLVFPESQKRRDDFAEDGSSGASKRSKRGSSTQDKHDEHIPVALIAMDTPTLKSNQFLKVLESNGWKVVVVHDGKDALRLLQMRNWDVVLLDDDIPSLPSIRCMAEFREWEAKNRVNEQRNVFLVCDGDIPDPGDSSSVVQPPCGFNGVLRKPVVWNELNYLIQKRGSNLNILVRK
jgi:CheY-like chemotaxis protein/signal transduction histidine kinase